MLMARIEPESSRYGSDHFANCATTNAPPPKKKTFLQFQQNLRKTVNKV